RTLLGGSVGLDSLASYGIIPTSPAWLEVEKAIGRLRRFDDLEYQERATDLHLLADYATMLERNVETIGQGLMSAAYVGGFGPAKNRSAQLMEALRIISTAYKLPQKIEPTVIASLSGLWSTLKAQYNVTAADPPSAKLANTVG